MKSRTLRAFAVIASASLILGAFAAGPADAKKKKKKVGCAPYSSSVEGAASAATTMLTAAATADKPVEVKITAPQGIPEAEVGSAYHNVVVNTAASSGLFARYEFPAYEDYDLYLLDGGGNDVAHAGGFNPAPFALLDGTGSGGHSEQGAEQIDGFPVGNCQGFTVDMRSYMGQGGELTLKLWLGAPAG